MTKFRNLKSYSGIEILNDIQGSSGTIYSQGWYNVSFGSPAPMNAGQLNAAPEYDFVFDYSTSDNDMQSNGCKNQFHREHRRRIVKHILRHDYLKNDFDNLVNLYGLNITLIDKKSAKRRKHGKAILTKYEINAENLKRIEAFYAKDFDEFEMCNHLG